MSDVLKTARGVSRSFGSFRDDGRAVSGRRTPEQLNLALERALSGAGPAVSGLAEQVKRELAVIKATRSAGGV